MNLHVLISILISAQLASTADISSLLASSAPIYPISYVDTRSQILHQRQNGTEHCRVFPGDQEWPTDAEWAKLNQTVGGALIKPVPLAAVCHSSWPQYDAAKCQYLLENWGNHELRVADPSSILYPYYQGASCLPSRNPSTPCTIGGSPEYVVNVTTPAQISAAIAFAKEKNVRLIVKNTGHDISGKSTGAGSLSIWTHNMNQVDWLPNYSTAYYTGPAVRVGAGVELGQYYQTAEDHGVTLVGGECSTVGVAGGYLAGGGHSPSGGLFGMGADNVVELTAVLPNGTHVNITPTTEPEFFWAFRGGGGSTFGVVTSVTVKAHPKIPVTVSQWDFSTGPNVTNATFWAAFRAYLEHIPAIADSGSQAFPSFQLIKGDSPGFRFNMTSFFAPNMTISQYDALMAPFFKRLTALGLSVPQHSTFHETYLTGWERAFPKIKAPFDEHKPNTATGSRLFPRKNFEDQTLLNNTFNTLKNITDLGYGFFFYCQRNPAPKGVDNAINPAYRDSAVFLMVAGTWETGTSVAMINTIRNAVSYQIVPMLKAITPGSGAYMNEADIREPDWQQSFFGANYPRLLALKKKLDPDNVFYAKAAVGSEGWYIKDDGGLPEVQNGRLCQTVR